MPVDGELMDKQVGAQPGSLFSESMDAASCPDSELVMCTCRACADRKGWCVSSCVQMFSVLVSNQMIPFVFRGALGCHAGSPSLQAGENVPAVKS